MNEQPQRLLPTTRTQVSGHRFMRRRVEHGLIYGDIRMIHDPLAARRRAAIFGVLAVALIAAGCGLFAWLRPNPDPGQAAILKASDGTLYVRVDDVVHPVTNLTSARLIAGGPEDPQRVGDERLVAMRRGAPVGIPAAPSMFAAADSPDVAWSACVHNGATTVVANSPARELADDEAVLTVSGGSEWLLTATGRTLLPAADSPEGRIIRREMGIDSATPRLEVSGDVLSAVKEHPPFRLPTPLPKLLLTDEEQWAVSPHGGIHKVTPTQRDILISAGAPTETVTGDQLATYPDAQPPVRIDLPASTPEWLEGTPVCATEAGTVGTLPREHIEAGAIELPGSGAADYFTGLPAGSVGVDTGHGFHVVSATGIRHASADKATLDTVGAVHIERVPWALLRLLPAGPELTRDTAMSAWVK